MTALTGGRAIRGPVTAVPMVGTDGVLIQSNTDTNQVEVKLDETVLYEDYSKAGTDIADGYTITLSELAGNFEYIRIHYARWKTGSNPGDMVSVHSSTDLIRQNSTVDHITFLTTNASFTLSSIYDSWTLSTGWSSSCTITLYGGQKQASATGYSASKVYTMPVKIVGVGRKQV